MIAEVQVLDTGQRGRRRWRWEVTWVRPVGGPRPGVSDLREHVRTNLGYARRQWSAWQAVRRAYDSQEPR